MKHIRLFEEYITEAKLFLFSFAYNTDEDDVDYIQDILKDANVDAIAQPGLESDEMVVKAKNAVELRKAKKAIKADGFEIYESTVNEARMMPIAQYYKNSGSKVKSTAKEIDAIINTADFVADSSKQRLLDLITDLVEEYHLEASMEADRNLQEAIDVDYWADYNTDTSGRGNKEFAEKSKKFNKNFFNNAMNSWNSEAESDSTLRAFTSEYSKIYKLAEEFFKKAGYISVNIIHAMIAQES